MRRREFLAGTVGLAAAGVPRRAQAAPERAALKFTLDWAFEGPESIFTAASKAGLFEREGLRVQIDRGAGSVDAVVRTASGAYDFG